MITAIRQARLLLPLILAVLGLSILISLGNWQMQRKAWKADLIGLVNKRLKASPISFDELKGRADAGADIRYQPVKLRGEFQHNHERHYFLPKGSEVGWHILVPFKLSSGAIVFIDRGFVPPSFKEPASRQEGMVQGEVEIIGLARNFELKGFFTPENNIKANKWYWRDRQGLYESLLGYSGPRFSFMVDQRAALGSLKWPEPGVTRVQFSDKHLGYALTWYGLALTLVGVFAAFAYQRLKRQKEGA